MIRIAPKGCWLRIYAKKYFRSQGMQVDYKDYYLSFNRFPYFLGATKDEIEQVTTCWGSLSWEALDIDLGIDETFEHPHSGLHYCFTSAQLKRLYDYNQAQIAKGGKPWLRDYLWNFPYWEELNSKFRNDIMTKRVKRKPCPFCGNEPVVSQLQWGLYRIVCSSNSHCKMNSLTFNASGVGTISEASELWNGLVDYVLKQRKQKEQNDQCET